MQFIEYDPIEPFGGIELTKKGPKASSYGLFDGHEEERSAKVPLGVLPMIPNSKAEACCLTSTNHVGLQRHQRNDDNRHRSTRQTGGQQKRQTLAFARGKDADDFWAAGDDGVDQLLLGSAAEPRGLGSGEELSHGKVHVVASPSESMTAGSLTVGKLLPK